LPHSGPAGIGPAVRRFGLSLLRLAVGVTVLWFLVRQVGAAPFEDGLRAVTWQAVVAAVTLTALTTVCSAWRWRVVARALGADIGLPGATGAYYRSLFLNSVLPGGILGDVHRAVIRAYGVHDEERNVAYRSTFIVDREGVLRWGHAGDRDMFVTATRSSCAGSHRRAGGTA